MIQQIFQSTHCVSEKTGFFSSLCVQWSSLVHFTLCYCMSHQWHLLISRTLVARFAALQKTVSSECNVASVRTAIQWTAGCQTQWRKVGERRRLSVNPTLTLGWGSCRPHEHCCISRCNMSPRTQTQSASPSLDEGAEERQHICSAGLLLSDTSGRRL